MSSVSEQANGRVNGPVLTSLFLFVPDHSAASGWREDKPAPLPAKLEAVGEDKYWRMSVEEEGGAAEEETAGEREEDDESPPWMRTKSGTGTDSFEVEP